MAYSREEFEKYAQRVSCERKLTEEDLMDAFKQGERMYLKATLSIIRELNDIDEKSSLYQAVVNFATLLSKNGEQELADYCWAQLGYGSWVVNEH